MINIQDQAQFLVSEAIKNKLSELDFSSQIQNTILTNVYISVSDRIETVTGILYSCEYDELITCISFKISFEDAFGLSEAWSNLIIDKFSLVLNEEEIINVGPYKILSFAIKDLLSEQKTCIATLKLHRE